MVDRDRYGKIFSASDFQHQAGDRNLAVSDVVIDVSRSQMLAGLI
jgi:hypothetical protein